jgi:biopolymer transport protein ExbD
MQFRSQLTEEESSVNLTPLIDVVFLLLIFFMVSTTFDTTSELKIELPKASARVTPDELDRITILINPKGNYFLNGKRLKNNSADLLLAEIQQLAGQRNDVPVVIQSDATSPVQSMVTALDVVSHAGLTRLSIATTRPLE